MLVLTRKPHERIIIGENILIVFLGMTGEEAKLGFTAPMSMPIHREEIYRKLKTKYFAYHQINKPTELTDNQLNFF